MALEQTPMARDLMSAQLSVDRYVATLATWVSAWTALESAIEASAFARATPALLPCRRAHLGYADLRYWALQGRAAPYLPVSNVVALQKLVPPDSASLLGMCYVVRGAALGAQVIERHLLKTLPSGAAQGIAFFAPGAATALSWPQWSHALNAQLDTPDALARAVVWADATFAALHSAFSCPPATTCKPEACPA